MLYLKDVPATIIAPDLMMLHQIEAHIYEAELTNHFLFSINMSSLHIRRTDTSKTHAQ